MDSSLCILIQAVDMLFQFPHTPGAFYAIHFMKDSFQGVGEGSSSLMCEKESDLINFSGSEKK